MNDTRVVVTGGAGFIGSSFINYLKENYKLDILCVDKLTYCSNINNIKYDVDFLQKDICDVNSDDLGTYQYLVNFAAESHVDNSIKDGLPFVRSNIEGTFNLLEIARKNSNLVKFIQISTDEVYGDMNDYTEFSEADESFPLKASSYYSSSKASADLLVESCHRTYGLPYLITRTCNNFGEHQYKEKFLPKIYESINKGDNIPIYGDGEQIREWIHVEDNVRYIAVLMFSDCLNQIVNIGSGFRFTNLEIVKMIQKNFTSKVNIESVEDRLGHDRRYSLKNEKLISILDRLSVPKKFTHISKFLDEFYSPNLH